MYQYPHQRGAHPPTRSTHAKVWRIVGAILGLPIAAMFGVCMYIGVVGPDIVARPGPQVPARHKKKLRELGVLEPGESVQWLYSDGAFSIEEGVYLFTDDAIELYSKEWDPPAIEIPFEEIVDLDIEYDSDFLTDSSIYVGTADGSTYVFPVSSEEGNDKRFFEDLERRWLASLEASGPASDRGR